MSEEAKLVRVYRAGNSIEGNFLQGLLAEEGIPAQLLDDAGRRLVSGNATGEVEVHVPKDFLEAAARIIDDYERRSSESTGTEGASWECLRCGEENESTFESCWNCQAEYGNA